MAEQEITRNDPNIDAKTLPLTRERRDAVTDNIVKEWRETLDILERYDRGKLTVEEMNLVGFDHERRAWPGDPD